MRRVIGALIASSFVVLCLMLVALFWMQRPQTTEVPFPTSTVLVTVSASNAECERLNTILEKPADANGRINFRDRPVDGRVITACLGEPTYYLAYEQLEPHDTAVILELWYPERGIYFGTGADIF